MSAIEQLRGAVDDYAHDKISTDAFCALWREQGGRLCERLPETYSRALDDALMRIESSRLFAGDSCSFSRESLLHVFGVWLERAESRLQDRED